MPDKGERQISYKPQAPPSDAPAINTEDTVALDYALKVIDKAQDPAKLLEALAWHVGATPATPTRKTLLRQLDDMLAAASEVNAKELDEIRKEHKAFAEVTAKDLDLFANSADGQNLRIHTFCADDLLRADEGRDDTQYYWDAGRGLWQNGEKAYRKVARKANARAGDYMAELGYEGLLGYNSPIPANSWKYRNDGVYGAYQGRTAMYHQLDQRERQGVINTELGYWCLACCDWRKDCQCAAKDAKDFLFTEQSPILKITAYYDKVTNADLQLLLDFMGKELINKIAFSLKCRIKGFALVKGPSNIGKTTTFVMLGHLGVAKRIGLANFMQNAGKFNESLITFAEYYIVYGEEIRDGGDGKAALASDKINELDTSELTGPVKYENRDGKFMRLANTFFIGNDWPSMSTLHDETKLRIVQYDLERDPGHTPLDKVEGKAWFDRLDASQEAHDQFASLLLRLASSVTAEDTLQEVSAEDLADMYETMQPSLQTAINAVCQVTRNAADIATYEDIVAQAQSFYRRQGWGELTATATAIGRAIPKPLGKSKHNGQRAYRGVRLLTAEASDALEAIDAITAPLV